ncbi:type 4 pilus major pilin [Cupriavidus sp. CuC1]|uniref:type 4 pilus major pilin n=1 Tax=Cupriavidus sp. CuC1 TaxID=3373131 RepID=UPI0037D79742
MQASTLSRRRAVHRAELQRLRAAGASKLTLMCAQAGYSMVEVGLVLVIVALALVGVILYFSSNSASSQANSLSGDLTSLIGKVKQGYQGNYAGVTNAALKSGGFFRDMSSMNSSGANPTLALGGGTLTAVAGTVNTANDSVQYTLTQIPDSACLPLVSSLASSVAFLSIAPNGGTASVVKAVGGVVDPSKISCSNDKNTLLLKAL